MISLFLLHQKPTPSLHFQAVLQRLLQNGLFCKLEKCTFSQLFTTFLGYVISDQGITVDPQKVAAVAKWPQPSSSKNSAKTAPVHSGILQLLLPLHPRLQQSHHTPH